MTTKPLPKLPDMITYNGHFIWYDKPELLKVDMLDIQQSLPNASRYNGQIKVNLLEHSLLCAELTMFLMRGTDCKQFKNISLEEQQIQAGYAAVHDIHEIYVTDLVHGMKKHVDAYRAIETAFEVETHKQIGLPFEMKNPQLVKAADYACLVVEMSHHGHPAAQLCMEYAEATYGFRLPLRSMLNIAERIFRMSKEEQWEALLQYIIAARVLINKRKYTNEKEEGQG